ncbi:hypothetical protein DFJ77DRAFT_448161 [Powellomyces hirtus]|nr:hypothetical protein DFJ77DRAFT_448161 [Powellomyces hirtus]
MHIHWFHLFIVAIWVASIDGLIVHKRDELETIFNNYERVSTIGHRRRDYDGTAGLEIRLVLGDGQELAVHVTPNEDLVANTVFANPDSDNTDPIDASTILQGIVRGQPGSSVRLAAVKPGLYEGHAKYHKANSDGEEWTYVHFEVVPSEHDPNEFDMISHTDEDVVDQFDGTPTCGNVQAPLMGGVPDASLGGIPDPFLGGMNGMGGMNLMGAALPMSEETGEQEEENEEVDLVVDNEDCWLDGKVCPLIKAEQPSTLGRRAAATPKVSGRGRDCPVAVVADIKFSNTFGSDTEMAVLSLFNDVDSIYKDTVNVRTPVNYLYVVRDATDKTGFGKPAATANGLLTQLVTAIQGGKLPNLPKSTCLVHVLTVQDFNPTLGLAYVGKAGQLGGICSGNGYNAGISTPVYASTLLARSTFISTVTHELGHGMGSNHDTDHPTPPGNPASCNPSQPYIMYPSAAQSSNWRRFSNCSMYTMNAALDNIASCFVARNSLSGLQNKATTPTWYTEKIQFQDQCKNTPGLTAAPPGGYTDCPYATGSKFICTLVCQNPTPGASGCVVFPDSRGYNMNKTDGTMCGGFNDQSTVCLKGVCKTDTRTNVCDRRKPCCDAYGVLLPKSKQCGAATSCASASYCNGLSDACPSATKKASGTTCALKTGAVCKAGNTTVGVCGMCDATGTCIGASEGAAVQEVDGTSLSSSAESPLASEAASDGTVTAFAPLFSTNIIRPAVITGAVVGCAVVVAGIGICFYKKKSAAPKIVKAHSISNVT